MTTPQPRIDRRRLHGAFQRLLDQHGPQDWWPSKGGPFEIMVGAVLTQNTAWTNVEKALARLHAADAMSAEAILALPEAELAERIRPSGYFNIKADRLRQLCRWYVDGGGFDGLARLETPELRRELLSVKGIGPETADDIVLYAFHRPVFVVDAYTFRIFERMGLIDTGHRYEPLRAAVESATRGPAAERVGFFNELHALIVRHGSRVCRPKPDCGNCALRRMCAYNLGRLD